MTAFREESEEHVVHRLEAFSDIVIGFSLAQMTLNLVLPADVLDLFTKHVSSLLAFGLTFAIVSGMWWSHHRLFTHYFVPTTPNIVLNFLSLGGVMFLVYTLQVWLHSERHLSVAYVMYCGSIAWIIGIIAFLTYRGVVLRGHKMTPQLAMLGRNRARRLAVIALAFVAFAVYDGLTHSNSPIQSWIVIALLLAVGLLRFWERGQRSRAMAAAPPGTGV